MSFYIENIVKEKYDALSEIESWFNSEKKVLNLLTLPYGKIDIFIPMLRKMINFRQKVLYISGSESGYMDFINMIHEEKLCDYYIYNGVKDHALEAVGLVITSFRGAISLDEKFDLVIYDEASAYSNYSKYEIVDILAKYYKYNCRIIARSIEMVFKNAPYIEMPARVNGVPLNEPRFISTRLDLNKEMPYVIYEYLEWCTLR